jgi:dephospho-CoA kinase
VLQMFARLGAAVIDADAISRSVTSTGGGAITPIAERFGAHFITPQGALDRALMRDHAYANPAARGHLEAIIHPLVGEQSAREVQAALDAGVACIVFDIPLLVESGRWRRQVDRVLVIDCSPQTQIARVAARSGLPADEVQRIMAAQASREARLAAADIVICNEDLSLEQLRGEVAQAAHRFGLIQAAAHRL